jgi:hypothetical protein
MGEGKVLLDWMGELPWKQQSVIISSLRGPDNHYCPNIKKITRWLRGITQNNADPSHSYMQREEMPTLDDIEKEFEFCSVHYAFHLLHGLEIIGYKHPDEEVAETARNYYHGLARGGLHLNPETSEQLDDRLKDKV